MTTAQHGAKDGAGPGSGEQAALESGIQARMENGHRLSSRPCFSLLQLLQQAVLTMSENGTEFEANADTLVEYSYRDLTVRFNRPFLVIIGIWNDFNVNIPLFMGKVVNPKNISSSIPMPQPPPPSHVPTPPK